MRHDLGILGAGAQAREVAEFAVAARIAFRAVSAEYATGTDLIDITTPSPEQAATPVIAAVGPPALRRSLVEAWPGRSFETVVAPTAYVSPSAVIGPGSLIAPGAVVTAGARIGEHVIVNVGATVSHDCVLGDFTTLAPGVNLGGGCRIGPGAFLGIGSTVRDGVRVAEGVVVGAGAAVVSDLQEMGIYVGVPARIQRSTHEWMHEI